MIKLKSLFRRGQGPSGSSKHSTSFNSQLQSSASTSSLNSIGTSTPSTSPVATTLSKGSLQSAAFYDSHDSLDSRGTPENSYQPQKALCSGRNQSYSSTNIQAIPKNVTNVTASNSSNSLFTDTKDIAIDPRKPIHIPYCTSSLQDLSRDDDINLNEAVASKPIVSVLQDVSIH